MTPRNLLGQLRDGDGAEHDAEPQTAAPASAPARPDQAGGRGGSRALTARARAELDARPGTLHHDAIHGHPESIAEHRAYIASRAWAHGRWSELEGVWFDRLIGTPLHRLGLGLAYSGQRQLRFWRAFAVFAVTVLPLLIWLAVRVSG